MRAWLRIAAVLAVLGMACSALMLRILRHDARAAPGQTAAPDPAVPDPGWEGTTFPPFSLTDQTGATVDETILDGRITIADFFFTHCPFVCPGMNGAMAQLEGELAGTPVQFVGISVDPQRDTVDRLAQYAENFGARAPRWRMLTGPREQVWTIIRDALRFEVSEDTETTIPLNDGESMPNIMHPSHLVLIGPQRQVLGIYLYSRAEEVGALRERARALAAGPE